MNRRHLFYLIALIGLTAAAFVVWDSWSSQARDTDVLMRPIQAAHRHVESYYGSTDQPLREPQDVAVAPTGEMYVADTGNSRILAIAADGTPLRSIGTEAPSALKAPTRVIIDAEGTLVVVDPELGVVRRYNTDGSFIGDVLTWGEGSVPSAIAVDASGRSFVADVARHVVAIVEPDGTESGVLGRERPPAGFPEMSLEPGRLDFPNGVEIDGEGRVWVVDSNNARIQIFDPASGQVEIAPPADSSIPPMSLPRDIAFGADGMAFVPDPLAHLVFVLDATGVPVASFGGMGIAEGELFLPIGVATDASGRVYVAEKGADRVSVFAKPQLADLVPLAFSSRVALPLVLILGALIVSAALLLPTRRPRVGATSTDSSAVGFSATSSSARPGSATLAIDLSSCLECGACERACATAHGVARFDLGRGAHLTPELWAPTACTQCRARSCVKSCPVGAMRVDGRGVAYVGDGCISCGACAAACAFDGIRMVDIDGQRRPAKCDLCVGRRSPACAAACPTAAFKIRTRQQPATPCPGLRPVVQGT